MSNTDGVLDDPPPLGVQLADYGHVLREVVPGAELRSVGYGVEALFALRVTLNNTRAVNEHHATEMMRAYGEQIRARAIRTLGVQPILDGYRAEVEQTLATNRALSSQLDSVRNQLTAANARISALEEDGDPSE